MAGLTGVENLQFSRSKTKVTRRHFR